MNESTVVEVIPPSTALAVIEPAESLMQKAEILIRSGMLPVYLKRPEQVVAIMLRGRELGIGYMEALTSLNFIQGKVSSSTQLMLALIYRSGKLGNIEMIEGDPAKVIMQRKGMTPHTVVFGTKEATAMGLMGKENYRKQARTMFMWRAIAICARRVFPDVVAAVYTPDELGLEIQSDTLQDMDNAIPIEIEVDELTVKARELKASGMGLPAIAKELGLNVPEIAKRLK